MGPYDQNIDSGVNPNQLPLGGDLSSSFSTSSSDSLIGRVLENRYRIDAEVGRGGMGIVYRGTDLTLSRPVAIKTILHRQADQITLGRFIQEAKMLAQIEHSRLVPVYAVGQDEGYHYLVMKFLEGETLAQRLKREGRQNARFTRQVVQQVCEALGALHQLNLIHRDIKPANLMISPQESVTVMDLGIAKRVGEDNNTSASIALGTPRYMPPEAVDNRPLDPRADLYSLGVIAFQMLVGETPFDGPTPMAILYKQAHQAPPLIREKVSDAPKNLESAIEVALQKDPDQRFQSTIEMKRAFEESATFTDSGSSKRLAFQIAFITGVLGTMLAFSDLFKWRERSVTPLQKPVSESPLGEKKSGEKLQTPKTKSNKTNTAETKVKSRGRTAQNAQPSPRKRTPKALRDKAPKTQTVLLQVSIKSRPSRAGVYLNNKRVGRTPFKVTKSKGETETYTLKLKGFKDRRVVLRDDNVWVSLNSVFD